MKKKAVPGVRMRSASPTFAERLGIGSAAETLEDHRRMLEEAQDGAYLTSDAKGGLCFANAVGGSISYSGASLTGAISK